MGHGLALGAVWCGLAVGAAFASAGPAQAGALEDVAVGVLAHNIRVIDPKNANKEDGPSIEVQATFASPGVLRWIGAPHPYVSLTPNVAGDTSFAAVGLEWRFRFAEHWSFNPGLGYAVHDGELSNPFPNGDPRATAFTDEHVLLGSRDLFRTSLGVSRDFGERLSGQVYFVHYSHGQILGEGRNQGMDQAGVRLAYRFGD